MPPAAANNHVSYVNVLLNFSVIPSFLLFDAKNGYIHGGQEYRKIAKPLGFLNSLRKQYL
jgi:hypothetical protein